MYKPLKSKFVLENQFKQQNIYAHEDAREGDKSCWTILST